MLPSDTTVFSWPSDDRSDVQGLASRLAELLAAQSPGGSTNPIRLDGGSAAGGSTDIAAAASDPVEAIGQSVLIPMLMNELNQATFTGVYSCACGLHA